MVNVYEKMYAVKGNGDLWLARRVKECMKEKGRKLDKQIDSLEEHIAVLLQVNGNAKDLDGYKGLGMLTAIKHSKKYTKDERVKLLGLNGVDVAEVKGLPTETVQDKVKYLQELVDDAVILSKAVNIRGLSATVDEEVNNIIKGRLRMVLVNYKGVENTITDLDSIISLYNMDVLKELEVEIYGEPSEEVLKSMDDKVQKNYLDMLNYDDRPMVQRTNY